MRTIDPHLVSDYVTALQSGIVDKEAVLDDMAQHLPEAFAALENIRSSANRLKSQIVDRAAKLEAEKAKP